MTVEEVIAREEIMQLRSKYSHFYDANRLEDLVDLFTEDAVCEWDEAHGGCWIGREEIRTNYSRCFKEFGSREWIVMHAVTNPWIEITSEDTAEGRWFMLDFNFCGLTQDPLGCIGVYDDLYKKSGRNLENPPHQTGFSLPRQENHGRRSRKTHSLCD